MGTLLILLAILIHQGEGMIVKHYGNKYGSGGMFFNAVICLFSMLFFILTDKNGLYFPPTLFAFGLVSCLMYAAGFGFMYLALQCGSYALTRLIASMSGIIAILYGIVFLEEPAGGLTYLAIGLVFLSVILMNYRKKEQGEKKGFSLKWLIYVLITALSNGLIAVLTRMQQLYFNDACSNEFKILSLGGACIALVIIGLFTDKGRFRQTLRQGTLHGTLAGLLNGANNYLTMTVYLFIPISLATSLRTGLEILASFAVSVLIYRETFTRRQVISALIGIVALVLLQIA